MKWKKRRVSLAEQQKVAAERRRAEQEKAKAGFVKITVRNANQFDKVTLTLRDDTKELANGASIGLFADKPPGIYDLSVVGEKDDQVRATADFIEVTGGTISEKALDLPES
jgi:hypothetical protein